MEVLIPQPLKNQQMDRCCGLHCLDIACAGPGQGVFGLTTGTDCNPGGPEAKTGIDISGWRGQDMIAGSAAGMTIGARIPGVIMTAPEAMNLSMGGVGGRMSRRAAGVTHAWKKIIESA